MQASILGYIKLLLLPSITYAGSATGANERRGGYSFTPKPMSKNAKTRERVGGRLLRIRLVLIALCCVKVRIFDTRLCPPETHMWYSEAIKKTAGI